MTIHPAQHSAPRAIAARACLIALAIAALLLSGCGAQKHARNPRVPVTVATAVQRTMPFALSATGTVEPIETASVGSQVGGVVRRVAFREGDEVREGQVLFELDARPFQAALEQARGVLQRDRAQSENTRLDAERARAMFEQNLISKSEWDQKRAAADGLAGTVRADSGSVSEAALNLHYASIRAPIAGRTGRLLIHEGDYVKSASADPLVTINHMSPVRVRFTVPETAVPMVQRYRNARPRVEVHTSAGDSLSGSLVFVDNGVDAASGTLMLKGEFANRDGRLVAGQFVDVRLVLYEQYNATVVPAPAVTTGQQGTFVYVLNPDSTVATRSVTVDRTVDEMAIVSDGLKPGETVITDGQLRLSPGAKVMVRRAAEGSR